MEQGRLPVLAFPRFPRFVVIERPGDEAFSGALGKCVGFLGSSSGTLIVFSLESGAAKIYQANIPATYNHIYDLAIAGQRVFLVDYQGHLLSAPLELFELPGCRSTAQSPK